MITAVQAIDLINSGGEVVLEEAWGHYTTHDQAIGGKYRICKLDSPDNTKRHAMVGGWWWPLSALSLADKPEAATIELTKEALYARWKYFEKRCELAEKFIEESPCDPDITVPQMTAYQEWNRCKDFGHFTPSIAMADFMALYKGAMSVLISWDERMQGEREEYKDGYENTKYWSPAASFVSSKNIAELRAALESIKHLVPEF